MKTTILSLILIVSALFASADPTAGNIGLFCWSNGQYNIHITNGPHNGSIKVTTKTSPTGTILAGPTLYRLDATGAVNFTVPQPNINTPVYVSVQWFSSNNGTGESVTSGTYTSSCTVTPILFGPIAAQNVGNSTLITFQIASTDASNQITINFNMPNGSVKQYPIIFTDKLYIGDIWTITINNQTGGYTVKKK